MRLKRLDVTTTALVGLLLAVFTVIFAVRASKMMPTDFSAHRTVYLDDMAFKTGDLLFYQCCPFINFTVNSVWSHVGIVFVHDGVAYTADVASVSGFTLKPVHDVVLQSMWDGRDRVAVRQACGRRRIDPCKLSEFLQQHVDKGIPYSHEYWRACFDRTFPMLSVVPPSEQPSSTTFCSHFVAAALGHCGALSNSVNANRMLPCDMAEDTNGFEVSNGHLYAPITMLRLRSRHADDFEVVVETTT